MRAMNDVTSGLRTWFEERRVTFTDLGLGTDFNDSPPDRAERSAALTGASARLIGQLVISETGEAELSLADVGSDGLVAAPPKKAQLMRVGLDRAGCR